VDNHISNSKYCLTRLLSDRGKEPLYQQVTRAKTVKDLCDALQVEYTEKFSDIPSRGENSAAAKAAEGKQVQRQETKTTKLRGVSDECPSNGFITGNEGMKGSALTA
jgi:hypothetical protein